MGVIMVRLNAPAEKRNSNAVILISDVFEWERIEKVAKLHEVTNQKIMKLNIGKQTLKKNKIMK